ncbi:MAG TPA: hypothetical protein PK908_07405 [Bacteroidales bacterium]|nr:hypothetical protein [Bacteroidales bacterium]
MLEYTKTILQKVSFSKELFSRELRKSFKWLQKDELVMLYAWCLLTFNESYQDIIREVFKNLG